MFLISIVFIFFVSSATRGAVPPSPDAYSGRFRFGSTQIAGALNKLFAL